MELDNCFEQNNGIFILDSLYHQVLSNCSKSIENEIVYHIEGHFGIGQDSNEHTIKHFSLSYNITYIVTKHQTPNYYNHRHPTHSEHKYLTVFRKTGAGLRSSETVLSCPAADLANDLIVLLVSAFGFCLLLKLGRLSKC
jgi:hypothetical protein